MTDKEYRIRELIAEVEAYLMVFAVAAPLAWLGWMLFKTGHIG